MKSTWMISNKTTHLPVIKLMRCLKSVDTSVKFIDLADVENIEQIHTLDGGTLSSVCEVEWVEWSADGQMLAFALSSGRLQVFLTKLKLIGSAFQGHTAYLSSLLEVSYYSLSDCGSNDVDSATLSGGLVFKLDLEPQQIAVGSAHLASCINNRVCFYSIELARQSARNGSNVSTVIGEREYASIVRQMKLNHEYAAILFTSGDVLLHLIETPNEKIDANEEDHKESKRFPCGKIEYLPFSLLFSGRLSMFNLMFCDKQIINKFKCKSTPQLN